MKMPDRVYIREYPDTIAHYWEERKKDDVIATIPHEYISKDALMDYFHKRIEDLNSPLNGVFGSTEREHCNERISELLLLIDKLNSM